MNPNQPPKQSDNLSLILNNAPSTGPGTQPLKTGRGTRPLMDENVLRVELEQTLSKAGKLAGVLENRMELLFHSCQSAGLSVPGVAEMEFKHAITAQGKKIIAYLEKIVQVKPDLARKIQVAIFRYQEAVDAHTEARQALKASMFDETMLEQLKLKFFYLANYHQEFAEDPLLAQMFPKPKGTASGPLKSASGQIMPAEIRKYRQKREITVRRADTILKLLQPGMEKAKQMLDHMNDDNSRGKSLLDIFNPTQRQERLLAQRLKEDPRCTQVLKNAYALYGKMFAITQDAKRGGAYEPLLETIEYMGQLAGIWSNHHLLREFFPTLRKELFANPGTGSTEGTGQLKPKPPQPGSRARGTGRLDSPG